MDSLASTGVTADNVVNSMIILIALACYEGNTIGYLQ